MTAKKYDYRYEVLGFQRHEDGSCSYRTRGKGVIPYDEKNFRSTKLYFKTWSITRKLAEKNGKDVVSYVIGNRILSQVKSVCSIEKIMTN